MMKGLANLPGKRRMRTALLATSLACAASATLMLSTELQARDRFSALNVVLNTAASLIALLVAFLVVGRFARRALVNELVLVSALAVLALCDLSSWTLPALGGPANAEAAARASLAGSMLGALLFALAAYVPSIRVKVPGWRLAAVTATATALAVPAVLILPARQ